MDLAVALHELNDAVEALLKSIDSTAAPFERGEFQLTGELQEVVDEIRLVVRRSELAIPERRKRPGRLPTVESLRPSKQSRGGRLKEKQPQPSDRISIPVIRI